MSTELDQPLPDETIARARSLVEEADLPPGSLNAAVSLLEDMVDEVDRLRAERDALAAKIAAVEGLARNWSSASHEVKAEIDLFLQEDYGTTAISECSRAVLRALGLDQDGGEQDNA